MQQLQMLDIPNNCSAWCHNSFLHFDVSKGCVELIWRESRWCEGVQCPLFDQGKGTLCIWLQGLWSTMPPGYQLAMVGQGSNCHSKRCTRSFKIRKICLTLCQVPSTQVGLGNGTQDNLHWNNTKPVFIETKSTSIFYNLNKYQFLHKNKDLISS